MGIIDRIILSVYTLLLAVLSLGVIGLSAGLVPVDFVWTGLTLLSGQWEAGLVGAVFLLVSIRLLLAGVRSSRWKDTIIHHTGLGDVHISLNAVENLIEKTARHSKGVRGIKVRVSPAPDGMKVHIRAIISPDCHVPSVTAEIQDNVKEHLRSTVGVEMAEILILVENISNEFKSRHRVE